MVIKSMHRPESDGSGFESRFYEFKFLTICSWKVLFSESVLSAIKQAYDRDCEKLKNACKNPYKHSA